MALLILACRSPADEARQVRGIVVAVAPRSITQLDSLEIRTQDGRVIRFRVEGDVGILPSHAREHMLSAEPVTITYRQSGDELLALRVDD